MQLPEIGEGNCIPEGAVALMCFSSGYSSEVGPHRCPFRFTGRSSYYTSFPISSAKVLQLFDICKCFGEKIAKICCKT